VIGNFEKKGTRLGSKANPIRDGNVYIYVKLSRLKRSLGTDITGLAIIHRLAITAFEDSLNVENRVLGVFAFSFGLDDGE
jgi:hypothetical protein